MNSTSTQNFRPSGKSYMASTQSAGMSKASKKSLLDMSEQERSRYRLIKKIIE